MQMSDERLRTQGFWRAGTVYPDSAATLRVDIERDVHGFVVYVMVVNGEVMKAGKTETALSTRMRSTFNSLKNKMRDRANHPRYQERTFKEHAQTTIRAGRRVEIWAKYCGSYGAMMATEKRLNDEYKGLWTKEGHRRSKKVGTRPTADDIGLS